MALTLPTTVPVGGKGASARCSKIFALQPDCDDLVLDGTPPSGNLLYFSEQVIRISINEEVSSRRYGHDKSFCAQDATPGLASWNGEITTFLQCVTNPISLRAGQIVWLDVWPLGTNTAAARIAGYAMIDSSPISMTLENGQPVERNYRFSSKGWWIVPEGVHGTFDCCNCCGVDTTDPYLESAALQGFESGLLPQGLPEVSQPPAIPYTVYQWGGEDWILTYSECRDGFVPGEAPTKDAPGAFQGEMKFVACLPV